MVIKPMFVSCVERITRRLYIYDFFVKKIYIFSIHHNTTWNETDMPEAMFHSLWNSLGISFRVAKNKFIYFQ